MIDHLHGFYKFQASGGFGTLRHIIDRHSELVPHGIVEYFLYQGGFAGAGYAADDRDDLQRQGKADGLQVVLACSIYFDVFFPTASLGRQRDDLSAGKKVRRKGFATSHQFIECAGENNGAAMSAGVWSYVYYVIGCLDDFFVVFHDYDGVACIS